VHDVPAPEAQVSYEFDTTSPLAERSIEENPPPFPAGERLELARIDQRCFFADDRGLTVTQFGSRCL
jgi:hypothetical protein